MDIPHPCPCYVIRFRDDLRHGWPVLAGTHMYPTLVEALDAVERRSACPATFRISDDAAGDPDAYLQIEAREIGAARRPASRIAV